MLIVSIHFQGWNRKLRDFLKDFQNKYMKIVFCSAHQDRVQQSWNKHSTSRIQLRTPSRKFQFCQSRKLALQQLGTSDCKNNLGVEFNPTFIDHVVDCKVLEHLQFLHILPRIWTILVHYTQLQIAQNPPKQARTTNKWVTISLHAHESYAIIAHQWKNNENLPLC